MTATIMIATDLSQSAIAAAEEPSQFLLLRNLFEYYLPDYREGRSGHRHRTCVHTVGRQNTRGGKHLLGLASPSQRQGSPMIDVRTLQYIGSRNCLPRYAGFFTFLQAAQ